jgi:hypothetical protein
MEPLRQFEGDPYLLVKESEIAQILQKPFTNIRTWTIKKDVLKRQYSIDIEYFPDLAVIRLPEQEARLTAAGYILPKTHDIPAKVIIIFSSPHAVYDAVPSWLVQATEQLQTVSSFQYPISVTITDESRMIVSDAKNMSFLFSSADLPRQLSTLQDFSELGTMESDEWVIDMRFKEPLKKKKDYAETHETTNSN